MKASSHTPPSTLKREQAPTSMDARWVYSPQSASAIILNWYPEPKASFLTWFISYNWATGRSAISVARMKLENTWGGSRPHPCLPAISGARLGMPLAQHLCFLRDQAELNDGPSTCVRRMRNNAPQTPRRLLGRNIINSRHRGPLRHEAKSKR